jgi:hypothetical protein
LQLCTAHATAACGNAATHFNQTTDEVAAALALTSQCSMKSDSSLGTMYSTHAAAAAANTQSRPHDAALLSPRSVL